MKTILLDENLPVALRHLLAEFDVFLTGDKNLRYQQRIETREIAIIETSYMRAKLREMVPQHPDGVGVKPLGDLHAATGKTC